MADNAKRKADGGAGNDEKRQKTTSRKQWRVPKRGENPRQSRIGIQPGDSGIWVTCNKGKEGKAIGEMRDLFADYAERLYPRAAEDETEGEHDAADIETAIQAEVHGMKEPAAIRLFTPLRIDVQCVTFFKTVSPVDPVSFVKVICEDAMRDPSHKRTRFAKRLSPMTLMGRASAEGLEKVAVEVLKPHFHQEPFQKRKFAIKPTIRNHSTLTRDSIIKQIAALVGSGHQVDLTHYDLLIVVEVYQNICGISVVDSSFERLKRYNISEIFDPTPKEDEAKKEGCNDDVDSAAT